MWHISCCFVCASFGQLYALVSFLCLSTCNVITANILSANTVSDRFQNVGSVCIRKENLLILPEVTKIVGTSRIFCLEVLTRESVGLWPHISDFPQPTATCCFTQLAGTDGQGTRAARGARDEPDMGSRTWGARHRAPFGCGLLRNPLCDMPGLGQHVASRRKEQVAVARTNCSSL